MATYAEKIGGVTYFTVITQCLLQSVMVSAGPADGNALQHGDEPKNEY